MAPMIAQRCFALIFRQNLSVTNATVGRHNNYYLERYNIELICGRLARCCFVAKLKQIHLLGTWSIPTLQHYIIYKYYIFYM